MPRQHGGLLPEGDSDCDDLRRDPYITRIVDPLVSEYLSGLPAVMLVGPRATRKTTTALRSGASTMRLDRASGADAVRADPDAALTAYDEPIIIDEWQLVPHVLGAVKRAVDVDPRPGRFILTGSSSTDLTTAGRPATGRVVRIPVWGLTERELAGDVTVRPFISRLFDHLLDLGSRRSDPTRLTRASHDGVTDALRPDSTLEIHDGDRPTRPLQGGSQRGHARKASGLSSGGVPWLQDLSCARVLVDAGDDAVVHASRSG